MLKTSKACGKFSPDVFSLGEVVENTGAFRALSSLLSTVSPNNLKLMAAAMMFEHTTRRYGYMLGQVVYVRYRGGLSANYMSNFMVAYVLTATSKKVKLMGLSSLSTLTVLREGGPIGPTIYTKSSFEELREEMLDDAGGDSSESIDPAIDKLNEKRARIAEEYELKTTASSYKGYISTIDEVIGGSAPDDEDEDSGVVDLVSIVKDIERGFNVKKKASRYSIPKRRTSSVSIRSRSDLPSSDSSVDIL